MLGGYLFSLYIQIQASLLPMPQSLTPNRLYLDYHSSSHINSTIILLTFQKACLHTGTITVDSIIIIVDLSVSGWLLAGVCGEVGPVQTPPVQIKGCDFFLLQSCSKCSAPFFASQ